jgi:pyruvate/2-oxoglutarate dehydrogenase complex dihydrolipoamide dehydrogenase (E3) component
LPREDGDLAAVIEQQLLGEGVQLAVGVSIREVSGEIGHVQITYSDRNGTQHRVEGSHVLIATGRQPNIEALDLERAGVAVAEGRLVLDGRLRTQNRRILACGDVAGPFLFTHMAEHQAGIVLRNTLFRLPSRTETRAVPWCTFTDPELARVGLSEREAHAQSIPHRVYTFDFASLDRAVTDGLGQGRAKLITTPRGKILGAAIAGAGAGELIHEYVLALHKNLTVHDLAGTIHIYPTLAQINRRLAEQRLKAGLTPAIKRWIQRLFRLRGGL